jgi:hypothetical protein
VSDKKPTAVSAKTAQKDAFHLPPGSGWIGAWKKAAIVGVVGMLASVYGMTVDPDRFAFSYMFALFSFLSIGLGALFFVVVQHFSRAGWSVTVRRSAEFMMAGLPIFVLLIVPILLPRSMTALFPWIDPTAHHQERVERIQNRAAPPHTNKEQTTNLEPWAYRDEASKGEQQLDPAMEKAEGREHVETLEKWKTPYLNKTFFYIRAILYVLIWAWLAQRYFRWSVEQDDKKKLENTRAAQEFAPIAIILFGTSISFAAFDWLLSLDPMWYSTIFGVVIFAGSALISMVTLILFTLMLKRSGLLGDAVNVEHYHDMGKLMFGWLVFWAYVSFAQFFLIWYSNIPEELVFFHTRWDDNHGTWMNYSVGLVAFRFFTPFWFLMSRNIKRNMKALTTGTIILLVSHFVDMYWIVMPNYGPLQIHWLDFTCLLGVGGLYLAMVLRSMEGRALVPTGDPRLVRALKFENA